MSAAPPPAAGGPVPWPREFAMQMLADMVRTRRMEEACAERYGAGRIRGFLHLYVGEEAVATGVMRALDAADNVLATYREHGHALLRGTSMRSIMAEMYGKQEGCSRGRGGSMHLFDAKVRFFGGNAIVGGGLPVAVGLALAAKMRGEPRVTATFFGEGAVAEGAFHESLNLAALWQLPVLFCCENNLYAMGTALSRSQPQTDLCRKAEACGVHAIAADGMDVVDTHEAAQRGRAHCASGKGPCFIEFRTYRFRAHSMFDPELYRDKAEVERWKERGPIHNYTARLKAQGMLTEDQFLEVERAADTEVADALAYAEAGTLEPVADLARDLYTPAAS